MELKKFREYPFTADTEALANDCWYSVIGVELEFEDSWKNKLMLKDNDYNVYLYSEIQALREKPKEAHEIFVNVYQEGTIDIYKYQQLYDKSDVIKKFKGVECSELNHTNQWYMEIGTENIRIFKNSKVQYSTGNRDNKNYGIYILELIYEAEQAPEIPNSVLKDYLPPEKPEKIEMLSFKKLRDDVFELTNGTGNLNIWDIIEDKFNKLITAVNKLIERLK